MSSFTKAVVEIDDSMEPCMFKLVSDLEYHIGELPSEQIIDVPVGYETDLASVPRSMWWLFPPHGKYSKAAIVHDYLYSNAIGTKKQADKIFYEAMGVLGVPKWKRILMYWAVRVGGKGSYK
jgi:hypothetical protein